jgi:hypothetical protein
MENTKIKSLGEERFVYAARPSLDIWTKYPSHKTVLGNKEIMTSYTDSFGGLANTIIFEGNKVISVKQTHRTFKEGKERHEEISNSIRLENLAS